MTAKNVLQICDFPGIIIRPDAFKVEVSNNTLYVTYHLHTEIFINPKNKHYYNTNGKPNCIKIDNEFLQKIKSYSKPINITENRGILMAVIWSTCLSRFILDVNTKEYYIIVKGTDNLNYLKSNLLIATQSIKSSLKKTNGKGRIYETISHGVPVIGGRIQYNNGRVYTKSCRISKYGRDKAMRIVKEFLSKHLDNINSNICTINNKKGSYVDVS